MVVNRHKTHSCCLVSLVLSILGVFSTSSILGVTTQVVESVPTAIFECLWSIVCFLEKLVTSIENSQRSPHFAVQQKGNSQFMSNWIVRLSVVIRPLPYSVSVTDACVWADTVMGIATWIKAEVVSSFTGNVPDNIFALSCRLLAVERVAPDLKCKGTFFLYMRKCVVCMSP